MILYLRPDSKIKNVSKLIGWFSLAALEQIKRNLDNPDSVTFIWRSEKEEDKPQYRLIMQNANECVNLIIKQLKKQGLIVGKNYEKKMKTAIEIKEEHTPTNSNPFNTHHASLSQIYTLLEKVEHYEQALASSPNQQLVSHLIMLYNKVIEYYSALNDNRHFEYLQKLQKLFKDDSIQRLMDISDKGGSNI